MQMISSDSASALANGARPSGEGVLKAVDRLWGGLEDGGTSENLSRGSHLWVRTCRERQIPVSHIPLLP